MHRIAGAVGQCVLEAVRIACLGEQALGFSHIICVIVEFHIAGIDAGHYAFPGDGQPAIDIFDDLVAREQMIDGLANLHLVKRRLDVVHHQIDRLVAVNRGHAHVGCRCKADRLVG